MYEYLGKMPKDMALNCDFSKDLFDKRETIKKREAQRNIKRSIKNQNNF